VVLPVILPESHDEALLPSHKHTASSSLCLSLLRAWLKGLPSSSFFSFLFSSLHLLSISTPHLSDTIHRRTLPLPSSLSAVLPPLSPEHLHVVDPHPPCHHGPSLPRHLRPFDSCDSGSLSAATTTGRPCLSSAVFGGDLTGQDDGAAASPTQR
jgi:hypothetical protein